MGQEAFMRSLLPFLVLLATGCSVATPPTARYPGDLGVLDLVDDLGGDRDQPVLYQLDREGHLDHGDAEVPQHLGYLSRVMGIRWGQRGRDGRAENVGDPAGHAAMMANPAGKPPQA